MKVQIGVLLALVAQAYAACSDIPEPGNIANSCTAYITDVKGAAPTADEVTECTTIVSTVVLATAQVTALGCGALDSPLDAACAGLGIENIGAGYIFGLTQTLLYTSFPMNTSKTGVDLNTTAATSRLLNDFGCCSYETMVTLGYNATAAGVLGEGTPEVPVDAFLALFGASQAYCSGVVSDPLFSAVSDDTVCLVSNCGTELGICAADQDCTAFLDEVLGAVGGGDLVALSTLPAIVIGGEAYDKESNTIGCTICQCSTYYSDSLPDDGTYTGAIDLSAAASTTGTFFETLESLNALLTYTAANNNQCGTRTVTKAPTAAPTDSSSSAVAMSAAAVLAAAFAAN